MDSIIGNLQQMQLKSADDGNSFGPVQANYSAPAPDTDSGTMQNIISQLVQIQATAAPAARAASAAPAGLTSFAATSSQMLMKSSVAAQSSGTVQLQLLGTQDSVDQQLRNEFNSRWGGSGKAYVKDIFVIIQGSPEAQGHATAHDAYRAQVQARVPGNVVAYNFHGTTRACDVGENANETSPCFKTNCALCSIMRTSFQMKFVSSWGYYGKGFYTAPDPAKASNYARNVNSSNKLHAILLCSVVVGRKELLNHTDSSRTAPSPGYDSVEGQKSVTGAVECIVYREDAILPHALVVWSDTPVTPSIPSGPGSRTQTPVQNGIYRITNVQFNKVLDVSRVQPDRIWGFQPQSNLDSQLWIFQREGGGWVIRNKLQPDMYIGLANSSNRSNGSEIALVSYNARLEWEVMVAMNGCVRIGLVGNRSMEFDLDKRSGSQDRTHVTIWYHIVNGVHQRWYLDSFGTWNGGQGTGQRTQTPVNHGIYTITNAMFSKVLDMSKSDNVRVWGFSPLNGQNQSWIFEQESGGWVIRNLQRPDLYLGLTNRNNQSNGSELAMVQYGLRIVWEVMVAMNGSVRIGLVNSRSMEIDLDKRYGAPDRTAVTIWNHVVNAEQQRWYLTNVGTYGSGTQSFVQRSMVQATPVSYAAPGAVSYVAADGGSSTSFASQYTPYPPPFVPNGPVQIVNKRFKLTLDLDRNNDHVIGWSSHGGVNQQWIFEPNNGGYVIKSALNPQKYLGLDPQTRTWGSRLVCVDYADRVTWVLQAAVGHTVRIACEDDPSMNLDMSTFDNGANGSLVVLFSHSKNAEQQRWELVQAGGPPVNPLPDIRGAVQIYNHRFKTVLDLDRSNNHVTGWSSHGGVNQQWVVEREGSGYVIRSKYDGSKYLGLNPQTRASGSRLTCVDYADRVVWVLFTAENNTFRIACKDDPQMNLDLSTRGGANNGTEVILFQHKQGADQQRWEFVPAGSPVAAPTQTPVNGGVYQLVNSRFGGLAMDLSGNNYVDVIGYSAHSRQNQQWVFEQSHEHGHGAGWVIRSRYDSSKYLGLQGHGFADGSRVQCVSYAQRVTWIVQPAEGGTVRIAAEDAQSMNLDLSTRDRQTIILFHHTANATQQRWVLKRVE